MLNNPVILKELLQASRRRRMYWLRAALPAAAVVIIAGTILPILILRGQDWRSIKQVAGPVFDVTMWVELLAFSVLSAVFAGPALADEWAHRTMEILCSTPLSRLQIVYGKFASILGKVVVTGLSLLPVMGVAMHLSRKPTELVLRGLGVIVASAVLFGGLVLVRSAGVQARRRLGRMSIDLLVVYVLATVLLPWFVWKNEPHLMAAMPLWSFGPVIAGTARGSMAPGEFAVWAIVVPLAVGVLALGLTPLVFRRALRKHVGGSRREGRRRWAWLRSRRPPMRPYENPFYWQEKGPASRGLRWALPGVAAAAGVALVVAYLADADLRFIEEPYWLPVVGWIGVVVLGLATVFSTAQMFARERQRMTAEALILTGRTSVGVYFAKARAVLRNVAPQLLLMAAPFVAAAIWFCYESEAHDLGLWTPDEALEWIVPCLAFSLLGIAFAAVVGLVFSAGAKSPARAVGCLLLSLVWLVAFSFALTPIMAVMAMAGMRGSRWSMEYVMATLFLAAGLVPGVILYALVKVWTAFRLSLMLAATYLTFSGALTLLMTVTEEAMRGSGYGYGAHGVWEAQIEAIRYAVSAGLVLAITLFWFHLGVRGFERAMLGKGNKG